MIQRFRSARPGLARNLVFLFCGIVLCALPVSLACPATVCAAEAIKPALPQYDTLSIATPEWENQTNRDGTGLFFDILHAVYDPAGITLKISIIPTTRSLLMLKNQEVDASLGFYSEEVGRLIGWDFYQTPKHPLITERFVAIFKKKRTSAWHFPGSLRHARVAWIEGYDLDNRIPVALHYQKITTQAQGWNLLRADRVDFYIDSASDSMAAARKRGVNLDEYHVETLWADKMYIPFALSERGAYFLTVFDQRIKALRQSGELARIYAKWQVPLPPPE